MEPKCIWKTEAAYETCIKQFQQAVSMIISNLKHCSPQEQNIGNIGLIH